MTVLSVASNDTEDIYPCLCDAVNWKSDCQSTLIFPVHLKSHTVLAVVMWGPAAIN